MNKQDLIRNIAKESRLSQKTTKQAVEAFLSVVTSSLQSGDNVTLFGFGKFEVKNRARRVAFNPATKQKIVIDAKRIPVFKATKQFKNKILA